MALLKGILGIGTSRAFLGISFVEAGSLLKKTTGHSAELVSGGLPGAPGQQVYQKFNCSKGSFFLNQKQKIWIHLQKYKVLLVVFCFGLN